jgi:hypothetical protein
MSGDTTPSAGRVSRRKAALFSAPETLGQALYRLVHNSPQTVAMQAELLNLSPQFVYNIGNPNLESDGVTYPLKHLVPHTKLTKNRVVVDFIERQLGYVAVPVVNQMDLYRSSVLTSSISGDMLEVTKELGEAAAAIQQSIRDGKLTLAEAKRCRKELWDLVRCAVLLHEELKGVQ